MTLLVTGAMGHVGYEIVRQAAQRGMPVVALYRGTFDEARARAAGAGVQWVQCDLTDAGRRACAGRRASHRCLHPFRRHLQRGVCAPGAAAGRCRQRRCHRQPAGERAHQVLAALPAGQHRLGVPAAGRYQEPDPGGRADRAGQCLQHHQGVRRAAHAHVPHASTGCRHPRCASRGCMARRSFPTSRRAGRSRRTCCARCAARRSARVVPTSRASFTFVGDVAEGLLAAASAPQLRFAHLPSRDRASTSRSGRWRRRCRRRCRARFSSLGRARSRGRATPAFADRWRATSCWRIRATRRRIRWRLAWVLMPTGCAPIRVRGAVHLSSRNLARSAGIRDRSIHADPLALGPGYALARDSGMTGSGRLHDVGGQHVAQLLGDLRLLAEPKREAAHGLVAAACRGRRRS